MIYYVKNNKFFQFNDPYDEECTAISSSLLTKFEKFAEDLLNKEAELYEKGKF